MNLAWWGRWFTPLKSLSFPLSCSFFSGSPLLPLLVEVPQMIALPRPKRCSTRYADHSITFHCWANSPPWQGTSAPLASEAYLEWRYGRSNIRVQTYGWRQGGKGQVIGRSHGALTTRDYAIVDSLVPLVWNLAPGESATACCPLNTYRGLGVRTPLREYLWCRLHCNRSGARWYLRGHLIGMVVDNAPTTYIFTKGLTVLRFFYKFKTLGASQPITKNWPKLS